MLSFSGSLRVLVALDPCDMRAGFNTLQALVAEKLHEDVKSGTLFVFSNRRHNRMKVLYWDGTGLWILTKRHAPQCAYRFVSEDPLSISSAVRKGLRGVWCGWR